MNRNPGYGNNEGLMSCCTANNGEKIRIKALEFEKMKGMRRGAHFYEAQVLFLNKIVMFSEGYKLTKV